MLQVAVIAGDGIGKEVITEGVRTLEALAEIEGLKLRWEPFDLGADRYLLDGSTLPEKTLQRWRDKFHAIILGALGDPRIPDNVHAREILLGARTKLDLFINMRPIRLLDERFCPLKGKTPDDIDIVVFRENTEGLYTGIGGQFKRGTPDEIAIEAELNTRKGVERIIRAAFEYADRNQRPSVCMSDKSNAMRHGHDLWQRVFREVAEEYPHIESFHMYVDALCMELVRAPERFSVIVTNNLFGDIITDLGAQLQGGIGMAASGNIHPGKISLFEPVHGSAPDIAGKGIANPFAMMLAVGMLYTHVGYPHLEERVQRAVASALSEGYITRELGGPLRTREAAQAVLDRL